MAWSRFWKRGGGGNKPELGADMVGSGPGAGVPPENAERHLEAGALSPCFLSDNLHMKAI